MARIADLGLATLVEGDGSTRTHQGGTFGYQAPEVASRKYSSSADMYSLAVMFFEMACGHMPDITSDATFDRLEDRDDPATLELLQFMLKLKAAERPTASQVISHIKVRQSREVPTPPTR